MQSWKLGQQVQAGFMNVTVKAVLLDSVYIVSNAAGTQLYRFTPYNGISKITNAEARQLLNQDDIRKALRLAHIEAEQNRREAVNAVFA